MTSKNTTHTYTDILSKIKEYQSLPGKLPAIAYWYMGKIAVQYQTAGQQTEHDDQLQHFVQQTTGRSFSQENIRKSIELFRKWSLAKIQHSGLSWSHYLRLNRIKSKPIRQVYHQMASDNNWSVRELNRQISAQVHLRPPDEFGLRQHYTFEFAEAVTEKELEGKLVQELRFTMLELGQNLAFIGQQVRLHSPSGKVYYLDLVFYHIIMKTYLIVDLKNSELSHRDLGQMDWYIRLFGLRRAHKDSQVKGLILCSYLDSSLKQWSLMAGHPNLYVATYNVNKIIK